MFRKGSHISSADWVRHINPEAGELLLNTRKIHEMRGVRSSHIEVADFVTRTVGRTVMRVVRRRWEPRPRELLETPQENANRPTPGLHVDRQFRRGPG